MLRRVVGDREVAHGEEVLEAVEANVRGLRALLDE